MVLFTLSVLPNCKSQSFPELLAFRVIYNFQFPFFFSFLFLFVLYILFLHQCKNIVWRAIKNSGPSLCLYTLRQEMDLLNVCAGVAIKMLECYSSFEMSYSSESPGVLDYFGAEEKLNLAELCSTALTVRCPFSSSLLLCRLTDVTYFPLKFLKALWTKEGSSFRYTCRFALVEGNQTI